MRLFEPPGPFGRLFIYLYAFYYNSENIFKNRRVLCIIKMI